MRKRRLFRFVLIAIGLFLAISWGISGALEYGWARRTLLARLSASFGRPVDAGRFSFSLLRGPQLEVDSITVAEDPRFGQEYFLRADQLTVGLLWTALLRGRVEFGTLSLTHPSLNLVHMPDGHWNVESWLPPANEIASSRGQTAARAQASSNTAPAAPRPAARHLGRIEIDDGRINFKLGQEKLLFALDDVSGQLDQDDAGRWSIDLQAIPMRASIELQEVGTLRLQGTVAGTSARLRPASLDLTWEDASLADALRLASGQDYSVRGLLGAEISATIKDKPRGAPDDLPAPVSKGSAGATAAGEWSISGTLRLSGIHRWDLAARPTDPAVNVNVTAAWSPGTPQLQVARCLLEFAHSQLIADGDVDWSHGFNPSIRIASSSIDLGDLLAWRRSFRPNLRDDLAIEGVIGVQAQLAAWPPHIEQATLSSAGADVHLGAMAAPIHIGSVSAALRRDSLVLEPVSVSLQDSPAVAARARPSGADEQTGAQVGSLNVAGSLGPFRPGIAPLDWHYRLDISGQTQRAQDLAVIAQALGRPTSADWTVQGPLGLKLAWAGVLRHAEPMPSGTLDLDGLQLNTVLLNRPLLLSATSIELRPGERHVKLGDAQAFGTHWKGTLDQRTAEGAWQFDLMAARLDIADLDLWLGPRARPGFLQRILPFAPSGPPPTPDAVFRSIVTSGRLRIAELSLAPLHVEKLDAVVELNGRDLTLRHAQADFFDGRVTGDFQAQISAAPTYSFHGQFERVNLAALVAATSSLDSRLSGIAAGDLALAARGIGREQLLASLAGEGKIQVREPMLRGLDLLSGPASTNDARAGETRSGEARISEARLGETKLGESRTGDVKIAGETRWTAASADFHIGGGFIRVDDLSLATREDRFEVQGSIGLARQLDLRVWSLPRGAAALRDSNVAADREEWTIGGTLDAPRLTRQTRLAGDPEVLPMPATGASSSPASNPLANRR